MNKGKMKRKAGDSGENAIPVGEDSNPEKRKKLPKGGGGDSASGAARRSSKQWCYDIKGKEAEFLDEMGVNLLDDNSRDSVSTAPPKYQDVNLVLKPKDQNVSSSTRTSLLPDSQYFISDDSLNDSYTAPSLKSSSLSHHGYSIPVDDSVPDNFFRYARPKAMRRETRDLFSLIPDEIVLLVFKWLDKISLSRCALVCKRWQNLSQESCLWIRLDLGLRTIAPGVVGQVVSRGNVVLRMARSTILPPIFVSAVTSAPTFSRQLESRLQYLDLSMATIAVDCLENLLFTCRSLKKLALENCDVSEDVCEAIALNRKLEVLHMAMCRGITPDGIGCILHNCPTISELNLSWTCLTEEDLDVVCEGLPRRLERLCLAGNRTTLQDHHVETLVTSAPYIRDLDLSDASSITSVSLTHIVTKLRRLECISTSRCYAITPSSFLLLSSCPLLLYLNIFGLLRDSALQELKSRLEGIEINKFPFSSISRPTVGIKRTSIWGLRVRD